MLQVTLRLQSMFINFYNGGVEAQAFTDIEYLGNGVYRIPSSRYQFYNGKDHDSAISSWFKTQLNTNLGRE